MTELKVALDDESMDTLKAIAEANHQSEEEALASVLAKAVQEKTKEIAGN